MKEAAIHARISENVGELLNGFAEQAGVNMSDLVRTGLYFVLRALIDGGAEKVHRMIALARQGEVAVDGEMERRVSAAVASRIKEMKALRRSIAWDVNLPASGKRDLNAIVGRV